jgi:hypothetical protein
MCKKTNSCANVEVIVKTQTCYALKRNLNLNMSLSKTWKVSRNEDTFYYIYEVIFRMQATQFLNLVGRRRYSVFKIIVAS